MAEHTHIEWCNSTWNPITGCSVVSPGCTNCYAMRLAGTRLQHHPSRAGLTHDTKAGPVWTGEVRFNEQWLDQPLHWHRPRRIFVCAHGDLFHEDVPLEWIDRVMRIAADCPQHNFQVLTKRAARMRVYFLTRVSPRNVWLGVSAEDQRRADERISQLLATPAAVRFVSCEPLLGPIDLRDIPWPADRPRFPVTDDLSDARTALRVIEGTRIDWVIAGGESGGKARPSHPDWFRGLRDQCAAASVPFFFKQWGEWIPIIDPSDVKPGDQWVSISGAGHRPLGGGTWASDGHMRRVGKPAAGAALDGRQHREMPA